MASARTPYAARRSRVAAALTALAFVIAGLLGASHEATTRHVRCAEHGELIHSAIAAGAQLIAPQRDSVVQSIPTATQHEHEHCLLASASRALTVASRPPVLIAMPVVATALARAPTAHDLSAAAIYRTAPKTSPPV
jgi:hypothetical protein